MPRRKIVMYCETEQAWKEVKTKSGFTYECPEDASHTVRSVIDKGAVQDSEVLMSVPMVRTDGVQFDQSNYSAGEGNMVYFPGTVSLQTHPTAVKLIASGEKEGKRTDMQLREYQSNKVLGEWGGDLYGNEIPQIVTLDVGEYGENWPTHETILTLYVATDDKVHVHSLTLF